MKIYIAGKVSGLPYHLVSQKFGKHEVELRRQGHEPIVPLNLVNRTDNWSSAMRKCISAMMTCDAIHLLPDWKDSPGAVIEHGLAHKLNIPIVYIDAKTSREAEAEEVALTNKFLES
jgi:hypothetical protein